MKKKPYVIVAGAGISKNPPSNLPSWWQYNKDIIDIIKEQACELCPEVFEWVRAIDIEEELPVQCISELIVSQGAGKSYFPLLELLNSTNSNANHFALAELAKCGMLKAIVTTNFDRLIENAFMQEAVPLFTVVRDEEYYEASKEIVCRLFKIHGSVTDYASLIDTITQKSVGLSLVKRFTLSNIFKNSEIIVIGFSGADLDFDLDYIPFSEALEKGGKVTWILQPGSHLNTNIIELKKKYPDNFQYYEQNLSDLFYSLGVDYNKINNELLKNDLFHNDIMDNASVQMTRKDRIRELFRLPYIGKQGCVGYCISLLNMIGLFDHASKLAKIYENYILNNTDTFNVLDFGVTGVMSLALQKMRENKFEECILYNQYIIDYLLGLYNFSMENLREDEEARGNNKELQQEFLSNLVSTVSNLALAYFYKGDLTVAKTSFEEAKGYALEAGDIRGLALITYNLARIDYEDNRDYDKFLESLKISAEYAKKSGKLEPLVEILLTECKVRMEIGEYYLSYKVLTKIDHYLKNIGDFNLHINGSVFKAKYFLRIGKVCESMDCFRDAVNLVKRKGNVDFAKILFRDAIEMYVYDDDFLSLMDELSSICSINGQELEEYLLNQSRNIGKEQDKLPRFIIETLPDNKWRCNIIVCEYRKERKYLPVLFQQLCMEYTKQGNWSRLRDEAECYDNVAEKESDQSIALYYLGCADLESKEYHNAEKYFKKVIRLGKKANKNYWAWTYIELANIELERKNIDMSIQYYHKGRNELQFLLDINEVVEISMGYVQRLFDKGYLKEALIYAEDLLKKANNSNLKKDIEQTIEKFKMSDKENVGEAVWDIETASPQMIASEAIHLYEENAAYAWKLIRIAKERYEKIGNWEGVGRCENNMADFNNREGKVEEAVIHYEKAMHIKEELGDIKGVINQLSNIISLYVMNTESINVEKNVCYALLHIPEYKAYVEKYRLFYALHIYYVLTSHHAEALYFAKLAYEGVEYLPEADQGMKEILFQSINNLEDMFRESEILKPEDSYFNNKILEATEMYKARNFSDCYNLLNELYNEAQLDYFNLGRIKGTYGNACLYEERYQEAIEKFVEAKFFFSNVEEANKLKAKDHICTAVNGIVIALDYLGRFEESIDILRKELLREDLSDSKRFAYTSSLWNRLMNRNQGHIKKDDPLFTEILSMLNEWKGIEKLSHEEKGVLYSGYGMLYRIISDRVKEREYYEYAQKEFLIINSPHLERVELILKSI